VEISDQIAYVVAQIRKLRKKQGVTQFELSLRTEISQSFLACLENGKKQPSVLTLIRIADALQISPREFFPPAIPEGAQTPANKQRIKAEITALLEYL
jgi:transcriptional regulator with XRE-family HTH domain